MVICCFEAPFLSSYPLLGVILHRRSGECIQLDASTRRSDTQQLQYKGNGDNLGGCMQQRRILWFQILESLTSAVIPNGSMAVLLLNLELNHCATKSLVNPLTLTDI